jgi:hypothetical protein
MSGQPWDDSRFVNVNVVGFRVEASDGAHVGEVDERTADAPSRYVVIRTGLPLTHKHHSVPVSAIQEVDFDGELIRLRVSEEHVRNAPEWDHERPHHMLPADLHFGDSPGTIPPPVR